MRQRAGGLAVALVVALIGAAPGCGATDVQQGADGQPAADQPSVADGTRPVNVPRTFDEPETSMGTMPPLPPSTLPPHVSPDAVSPLLIGEWHLLDLEGAGADIVDGNLVEGTTSFRWDQGGLLGFVGHGRVDGCSERGGWFGVTGDVLSIVPDELAMTLPGCPVYVPAIVTLGYALGRGVRYEVRGDELELVVPDGLTFTFSRASTTEHG